MLKFVLISLAITYVNAGALLRGGLGLNGYGVEGIALSGGYAASKHLPVGPLPAAIQSTRTYEVVPVALPQEPAIPQIIEVEPSEQPVQVLFRSISSPVFVQQIHTPGAPGQYEATRSEDEPHKLTHEVYKPIIQEVREVIQPFRKVVQEVKPVLEEIHTVVAKGEGRIRTAVAPIPVAAPVAYDAPLLKAAPILKATSLLGSNGY